jgi:hypothetical protein
MEETMTQAKTLNIQIKWYLRFHDMAHDIWPKLKIFLYQ